MKSILKAIFKIVYPYYFMWDQWARFYIVNFDVLFYEKHFKAGDYSDEQELELRKELSALNRKIGELQKRGLTETQDAIDTAAQATKIESEINVMMSRRDKYQKLVQIKNDMRPYIEILEQWNKNGVKFS